MAGITVATICAWMTAVLFSYVCDGLTFEIGTRRAYTRCKGPCKAEGPRKGNRTEVAG